jgi:V-type H+-transporting ATPase subunit d
MRCNASGNLAKFLDFITYGYMIDNVILLLTGLSLLHMLT